MEALENEVESLLFAGTDPGLFLAPASRGFAEFCDGVVLAEDDGLVRNDCAVADSIVLGELVYDGKFAAGSDVFVEILAKVAGVFFEGESKLWLEVDAPGGEASEDSDLAVPHLADLSSGRKLPGPFAGNAVLVTLISGLD